MRSITTCLLILGWLAPAAQADWKEDLSKLVRAPASERGELTDAVLATAPGWSDLTEALTSLSFEAKDASEAVVRSVTGTDGKKRPWVLVIPEGYDASKATPLMVVLHGGVSRPTIADDPSGYATGPSPLSILSRRMKCLAAFPMGENGATWWDDVGIENVRRIVRMLKTEFNVDDDRVSLGGFSDGASAAFLYSMVDSTDYGALLALNGHLGVGSLAGKLPTFASNMANVPVYATTTFADGLYPSKRMRPTIRMAVAAGGRIRYREMQGGHD